MSNPVAFHQVIRSRRRSIGELVLAVVLGFIFLNVTIAIFGFGPDPAHKLAVIGTALAMLVPASWIAARALRSQPGTLFSVTQRIRWDALGRYVGLATVVVASSLAIGIGFDALGVFGADASPTQWQALSDFLPMAAIIVLVIPLQAAAEEVFFRGTILQVLGAWTSRRWIVIAISAAGFAAVHGHNLEGSITIFVMGAAAAWLTIRTGGLEASIGLHVVMNLTALLLAAATGGDALARGDSADWFTVGFNSAIILAYAALASRLAARRQVATTFVAAPETVRAVPAAIATAPSAPTGAI